MYNRNLFMKFSPARTNFKVNKTVNKQTTRRFIKFGYCSNYSDNISKTKLLL